MNQNFGFDYGRQIALDRRRNTLVAFLNHMVLAPVKEWSKLHSDGDVGNDNTKKYSRVTLLAQDYSQGKKKNSIYCKFNFKVEDIRNLKNVVDMRYAQYERKFFKVPSQKGKSFFSQCVISRNPNMNNPWCIEVVNGFAYYAKPDYTNAKKVTQRFSEDGFFDLITQVTRFIDVWEYTFCSHLLVKGYSESSKAMKQDIEQRQQQQSNGYNNIPPSREAANY